MKISAFTRPIFCKLGIIVYISIIQFIASILILYYKLENCKDIRLDEFLKMKEILHLIISWIFYTFVHCSIRHVVSNSIPQIVCGYFLEKLNGSGKMTIAYLLLTIGSRFGAHIKKEYIFGSSGCVFGLISMLIIYFFFVNFHLNFDFFFNCLLINSLKTNYH